MIIEVDTIAGAERFQYARTVHLGRSQAAAAVHSQGMEL